MHGTNLYRSFRNYGCRITDDLMYKGYRSLIVENEHLLIHILLDKGSEPIRFLHKPSDMDLIWVTRMGIQPAHALFPDYQTTYTGGWQEMFPEVSYTHEQSDTVIHRGESAVTPWDYEILCDNEAEVSIKLTNRLRSMPFLIEKEICLKSREAIFRINEKITNESPTVELQANWGHHLAYGKPFLTEATKVELSEGAVVCNPVSGESWSWPYAKQDGQSIDLSQMAAPGTERDLLYIEAPDYRYKLRRPEDGICLNVSWDGNTWPYLWYWQNFQPASGAPFYGCEYNIGLEMFNVIPKLTLAEAAEAGQAIVFPPRHTVSAWLNFEVTMS
ncbi:DUF4432 family protein [Paenibacillus sp. PAMC21692]|uniref:DUF4432 family protein n=1 Tax=Paenibacillus sp. PAMC21692 TaxID=2762320 RepID=UPI00164D3C85|nr:hypothetical protein [Paenibacillus sp. PAMC21692]QNK54444.1 hypothetical protein H7F31_17380 [Paenibacillus sp. PAMC21692]